LIYPVIKFHTNGYAYVGFRFPEDANHVLRTLKLLPLLEKKDAVNDKIFDDGKKLIKAQKRKRAGIIGGAVGAVLLTGIISGLTGYTVGRIEDKF
jgi:hypothetical protein